jgi:DNA-binding NarL/FixJ family response regulator
MPTLRLAILEHEQGIVDGYYYRLERLPDLEIVFHARTGSEFEARLEETPADVAVIDPGVPAAPGDPNPYPLTQALPRLRARRPGLAVLIVSASADATLIRVLIEFGINGYLVKSDFAAYDHLGEIMHLVAGHDLYLSATAQASLNPARPDPNPLTPRQRELLRHCVLYPNESQQQLAGRMGISASTARNLMSDIYQRLGVATRQAAVEAARQRGLI